MAKKDRNQTGNHDAPGDPVSSGDGILDDDTLNDEENATDELDITSINLDDTGPIDMDADDADLWHDTAPIPDLKEAKKHPMFQSASAPDSDPSLDEEEPDTILAPVDPGDYDDLDDMEEPPPVIDDDDDDDDLDIDLNLEDDTITGMSPADLGQSSAQGSLFGDDPDTVAAEPFETPTITDTGEHRTLSSQPVEPLKGEAVKPTGEDKAAKDSKPEPLVKKAEPGKTKGESDKTKDDQSSSARKKSGKAGSKAGEGDVDDAVDQALSILKATAGIDRDTQPKATTIRIDAKTTKVGKRKPAGDSPKTATPVAKSQPEEKAKPPATKAESAKTERADTGTTKDQLSPAEKDGESVSRKAEKKQARSTKKDTAPATANGEKNQAGKVSGKEDQETAAAGIPGTTAKAADEKDRPGNEKDQAETAVLETEPAEPSPPLLTVLDAMDRGLAASLRGESHDSPERSLAIDLHDQHLLFRIGASHYAVPFPNVLEIGRAMPVTPVPNVPDWVLGVSNLRGDILSIVDLSGFLGLGRHEPGAASRMIVMRSRDDSVMAGCIVPRLEGSHVLPEKDMRTPAGQIKGRTADFLTGVFTRNQIMVAVLDADALLRSEAFHPFGR